MIYRILDMAKAAKRHIKRATPRNTVTVYAQVVVIDGSVFNPLKAAPESIRKRLTAGIGR